MKEGKKKQFFLMLRWFECLSVDAKNAKYNKKPLLGGLGEGHKSIRMPFR